MAPIATLRTLGSPGLFDCSGAPCTQRKKALALRIYLTLEPGPHTRARLAGLLWGETAETKARHSLTQSIHRLVECLGPGALKLWDSQVSWAGEIDCDALRLERGTLDPEQYRTDFLAEFAAGPGAEAFHEWADAKRADYRRRIVELLERAGANAEGAKAWGEALQSGLRLLQIEPFYEAWS
jgi:DNA-binding SARP family transcriptional activator